MMPVYLREKKSSASYSPTNLFGQPLLVAVPRNGTTYEKLYDLVLKQLSRYVTPPNPNEEWWKTAPISTNGDSPTVNGTAAASTSTTGKTNSMFKRPTKQAMILLNSKFFGKIWLTNRQTVRLAATVWSTLILENYLRYLYFSTLALSVIFKKTQITFFLFFF